MKTGIIIIFLNAGHPFITPFETGDIFFFGGGGETPPPGFFFKNFAARICFAWSIWRD